MAMSATDKPGVIQSSKRGIDSSNPAVGEQKKWRRENISGATLDGVVNNRRGQPWCRRPGGTTAELPVARIAGRFPVSRVERRDSDGKGNFQRGGENWFQWFAAVNSLSWISYGKTICARVAARLGLEPRQTDSESVVLPLHHREVKPFRPAGAAVGKSGRPSRRLEPAMGLEPATPCLQNRCSAIELRRRGSPTVQKGNSNNGGTAANLGLESRDWWLPGDSNPEPTD